MSTAAQPQISETSAIDGKSSPDWMKTQTGSDERRSEQKVEGENFVELKYRSLENIAAAKLAKGIGLFSIGLGLAEMLMPAQVGAAAGLGPDMKKFLPALGAREVAHGIGIMMSAKPTTAVMTRIGGDAIDLAYLAAASARSDTNRRRLLGATIAVLGVTALDIYCTQKLSSKQWSERDGNPNAPTNVGQPSGRRAMIA